MNQFVLQKNLSKELQQFSHIIEFGIKKTNTIQLQSLPVQTTNNIRIYYILEGKFEWMIQEQHHVLYPGDLVLILGGQSFGSEKGYFDIGSFCWLHLEPDNTDINEKLILGKWSNISKTENITIHRILLLNRIPVLTKFTDAGSIFQHMQYELFNQEIGYTTRVNQLIDELFIQISRQLTRQNNSRRDFPKTFMQLEQTLRQNLSHQWTVEEMAALVGLGTTAFSEKVKNYTGFTPLNYLINIRISEAIKLLKRQDVNVTEIALETGFYSSQHFATTFKKLTGYTPSQFKKNTTTKK